MQCNQEVKVHMHIAPRVEKVDTTKLKYFAWALRPPSFSALLNLFMVNGKI